MMRCQTVLWRRQDSVEKTMCARALYGIRDYLLVLHLLTHHTRYVIYTVGQQPDAEQLGLGLALDENHSDQ